jgi:hypothetical protein
MREYPVIDSAVSVEKLRMRLKQGELEDYGEAFVPEFVYDVTKHLPRFSAMRVGYSNFSSVPVSNRYFTERSPARCSRISKSPFHGVT